MWVNPIITLGRLISGDVHDVGGNASLWCWSDAEAKDVDW